MDPSRHSITKYTNDKKTHAAINKKMFKRLGHINNQLYEVEFAKPKMEHKESIIVTFLILQYFKLRILSSFTTFSLNASAYEVPR